MSDEIKVTFRIDPSAAMREISHVSKAIEDLARRQGRLDAERRERLARAMIIAKLPRRLGWLVDHPRALRVVYRLRPKWRPIMYTRP